MNKAVLLGGKSQRAIWCIAVGVALFLAAGLLAACGGARQSGKSAETADRYCLWLLWIKDDALFKEVQSRLAAGQHFVMVSRQVVTAHPKRARHQANCLDQAKIDPAVFKVIKELDVGQVSKPFELGGGTALVMRTTESYRQEGHQLFKRREYQAAERAFARDLKLHPGSGSSWHYIGRSRAARGDMEGALEALRQAQRYSPHNPANYYYLGMTLEELGRNKEALQQFKIAQSKAPNNPALMSHLALVLAAQKQDLPQAEALARRAVQLAPQRAMSWSALGQVLQARGKKTEAVVAFHRALSLEPKDAKAGRALLQTMMELKPGQVDRLRSQRAAAQAEAAPPTRRQKAAPTRKPAKPAKPAALAKPAKAPVVAAASSTTTTTTSSTSTSTSETTTSSTTTSTSETTTTTEQPTTTTTMAPAPSTTERTAATTTVIPSPKPTSGAAPSTRQVARGTIPPPPALETSTTAPAPSTTAATTTSTTTTEQPTTTTSTTTTEAAATTTTTTTPKPPQKPPAKAAKSGQPQTQYFIQVSTNRKESLALRGAKLWRTRGYKSQVEIWVSPKGDQWYRLLVGPYESQAQALKAGRHMKQKKWVEFYRILQRVSEP